MSITKEHIYDTVHSWVTYATALNLPLCPPYLYYSMLRKWTKEVADDEFKVALRELVDTGRLKVDTLYGASNPRITLCNITDEQLN